MKQQQNITLVTKAGLCTGCGMCQTFCPEQAIQLKLLKKGWFQANVEKKLCSDCGLCLKVCGRNPVQTNTKCEKPRKDKKYNPFLGCFENCYLGHSTDIKIRWNATSGGLITSILSFCFRTGLIDCAIVASSSNDNPLISQAFIATSEKEILQTSGSRYAPIPINAALKKALDISNKIAVVGLPCHLQSLNRAEQQIPQVKKKVILRLGMFCSHNVSLRAVDFILSQKKLRKENILEFNYRGKGWPSGIRVKTKQGTIAYTPNSNSIWTKFFSSFVYSTPYCLACTDQTNELADISFGDAWLPDVIERDKIGRSICIVRSDYGASIFAQAVENKAISVTRLDPKRIVESQAWPLYIKKLNIHCRKTRYPENTVKVDKTLENWQPTISDRFVNFFILSSSTLSNYAAIVKHLSYITARFLILLAKPYNKILVRKSEELKNQYPTLIHSSQEYEQPQSPSTKTTKAGCVQEKRTHIVIVNQHGENRGDESALRGMLYGLKKMIPSAYFTVQTISPAADFQDIKDAEFIDTLLMLNKKKMKFMYYTLAALLHRAGLRRLSKLFRRRTAFIESLKAADIVISAPGGPYIGDLYQAWELTCAFPIFLSILLGKPTMIYGPSQGPFDNTKRNKWRKWLLSKVNVISVRERFSKIYLENLGITSSSIYVTADSCLQKPVDKTSGKSIIDKENLDKDKMLIGMVPLYQVPTANLANVFDAKPLAVSTLRLLSEIFDANFVLIPQLYSAHKDLPSLITIAESSGIGRRIHVIPDTYNSDEQQSLIGELDICVSFRYHPYIFAVRQGKPTVCIAYEHKAFGFAEAMNLEEYCLDLFSTTPEDIVKKIQQVWDCRDELKKNIDLNIVRLENLSLKNSELAAELLNSPLVGKKGEMSQPTGK
jgi:coenzyme F420 hydrogenase subunit beta